MFGNFEWLFWFVLVGGVLTIIYLITLHFVLQKEKDRSKKLNIEYLKDHLIKDERDTNKIRW